MMIFGVDSRDKWTVAFSASENSMW